MIDALARLPACSASTIPARCRRGWLAFMLEQDAPPRRPACCTPGGRRAAKLDAYLDDYACLVNALVSLYEADFDERWIDEAVRLRDLMLELFPTRSGGGFFFTARDHEQLIARQKDLLRQRDSQRQFNGGDRLAAAGKASRAG